MRQVSSKGPFTSEPPSLVILFSVVDQLSFIRPRILFAPYVRNKPTDVQVHVQPHARRFSNHNSVVPIPSISASKARAVQPLCKYMSPDVRIDS